MKKEYTYSIEKIYILKVLIAVRIVIKTFSIVGRHEGNEEFIGYK